MTKKEDGVTNNTVNHLLNGETIAQDSLKDITKLIILGTEFHQDNTETTI